VTGALRTSVSRAELEADCLWQLLASPRGTVARVEEIGRLPDLSRWSSARLRRAIDTLVGEGVLSEDASGGLKVAPYPAREAS